jgi:hypothetical protein
VTYDDTFVQSYGRRGGSDVSSDSCTTPGHTASPLVSEGEPLLFAVMVGLCIGILMTPWCNNNGPPHVLGLFYLNRMAQQQGVGDGWNSSASAQCFQQKAAALRVTSIPAPSSTQGTDAQYFVPD